MPFSITISLTASFPCHIGGGSGPSTAMKSFIAPFPLNVSVPSESSVHVTFVPYSPDATTSAFVVVTGFVVVAGFVVVEPDFAVVLDVTFSAVDETDSPFTAEVNDSVNSSVGCVVMSVVPVPPVFVVDFSFSSVGDDT